MEALTEPKHEIWEVITNLNLFWVVNTINKFKLEINERGIGWWKIKKNTVHINDVQNL
jgi:hypothetical protein